MDQVGFLKGPNVWPKELADSEFREPVLEYYDHILKLGYKVWEVLVVSLGHPASILDNFTKDVAM